MVRYHWTMFLTAWLRRIDGSYNLVSLEGTSDSPHEAMRICQEQLAKLIDQYPVILKHGVLQQRVETELFSHYGDDRPEKLDRAMDKLRRRAEDERKQEEARRTSTNGVSQSREPRAIDPGKEGGSV